MDGCWAGSRRGWRWRWKRTTGGAVAVSRTGPVASGKGPRKGLRSRRCSVTSTCRRFILGWKLLGYARPSLSVERRGPACIAVGVSPEFRPRSSLSVVERHPPGRLRPGVAGVRALDDDALDLVDGDRVRRPVVELRRLRRRVPGDPLRVLERPSVRQVRRDPRRPERVGSRSMLAGPPPPPAA